MSRQGIVSQCIGIGIGLDMAMKDKERKGNARHGKAKKG
jgi:hypothetical protein